MFEVLYKTTVFLRMFFFLVFLRVQLLRRITHDAHLVFFVRFFFSLPHLQQHFHHHHHSMTAWLENRAPNLDAVGNTNIPGKGRKLCPECKTTTRSNTLECKKCKHSFVEGEREKKTQARIVWPEGLRNSRNESSRRAAKIRVINKKRKADEKAAAGGSFVSHSPLGSKKQRKGNTKHIKVGRSSSSTSTSATAVASLLNMNQYTRSSNIYSEQPGGYALNQTSMVATRPLPKKSLPPPHYYVAATPSVTTSVPAGVGPILAAAAHAGYVTAALAVPTSAVKPIIKLPHPGYLGGGSSPTTNNSSSSSSSSSSSNGSSGISISNSLNISNSSMPSEHEPLGFTPSVEDDVGVAWILWE